ncbi:MAG: hypothetical protein ABIN36_07180, partial [Ferruginibacter sp.]
AESSAGAGTQPAGCGGESNEFEVLTKASKGYALILPNPILNIVCSVLNISFDFPISEVSNKCSKFNA